MGISEKIKEIQTYAEAGNIILYKEGNFWKAYEQSAYLFVKNIKEYLVQKKYLKIVSSEVVSLGFPVPSISKVLGYLRYELIDMVKAVIYLNAIHSESNYIEWKNSLPASKPNQPPHKIKNPNLPVFKATYDLLLYIYKINKDISREYKFSLTENIKKDILDLLVCIYNVETSQDKVSVLDKALDNILRAQLQIRLLNDLKQISLKQYSELSLKIDSISKQLTNWRTSCMP